MTGSRDRAPVLRWVAAALGSPVTEVIFEVTHMSHVVGVHLGDGREVVVKSRRDVDGRAAACVAVQAALRDAGFPCAEPVTGVDVVDGHAVHAEAFLPGGDLRSGNSADEARLSARLLAWLTTLAKRVAPSTDISPPYWVAWAGDREHLWPTDDVHDPRAGDPRVPDFVEAAAVRVRRRLAEVMLPRVVSHADWETQNLRWHGETPYAVHDWDSLATLPEAAHAGAGAAQFSSGPQQPLLAPLESSAAFLDAYQAARGRRFDREETEVAWAAGLWPALHNARMEAIYDRRPLVTDVLHREVAERLRLAGA